MAWATLNHIISLIEGRIGIERKDHVDRLLGFLGATLLEEILEKHGEEFSARILDAIKVNPLLRQSAGGIDLSRVAQPFKKMIQEFRGHNTN